MNRGLWCLLVFGCTHVSTPPASPAPRTWPLETPPAEFSQALNHAVESMAELQQALVPRLMVALEQGDVASAVEVCRAVAQPLTKDTAQALNLEMGRTSFRVRNPANAPRPWAKPFVLAAEGKKAQEVKGLVVDLGATLGVLKPIGTLKVCESCHGAKTALAPDVAARIAQGYPEDKATGFAEGDLRGFFWAEVPKK